jgi:hypothetical protein
MCFSLSSNGSERVSTDYSSLVQNKISNDFLFCEMVRNGILSIFIFRGMVLNNSTKLQSSECFSLPQNGTQRNSERFLFRETDRILKELKFCLFHVPQNNFFSWKMATLLQTSVSTEPSICVGLYLPLWEDICLGKRRQRF